jgi:hypothetical protein
MICDSGEDAPWPGEEVDRTTRICRERAVNLSTIERSTKDQSPFPVRQLLRGMELPAFFSSSLYDLVDIGAIRITPAAHLGLCLKLISIPHNAMVVMEWVVGELSTSKGDSCATYE